MGIGAGVFLFAIGAVLTFAVNYDPAGIQLDVVGWILMVAGAIALLMELIVFGPRRRSGTTVTERRRYDDDPPY